MKSSDTHWSDPKRTRTAIRHNGAHLGYITTVSYPHRDLTAFPEGSPYLEVVVSNLADRHIALFQRFKQHWLLHCGNRFDIVESPIDLSPDRITSLAIQALEHEHDGPEWLLATLKACFHAKSGADQRPS